MEPREDNNEDNNMVLLVVVSLICVTLVGFLEFGSTKPAVTEKPTVLASEKPLRLGRSAGGTRNGHARLSENLQWSRRCPTHCSRKKPS